MMSQTGETQQSINLPAVRRFYFYFVALVSLIAGLFAVDGLLAVLSEVWLGDAGLYATGAGDYWRNAVARNGGVLLVAWPVYLLHWGYIQRRLVDAAERRAALRKLFLYGAGAAAIAFAATRGYDLLAGAGFLALGGAPARSDILAGRWLHLAVMSGLGLALTAYYQHIVRTDGDYGLETTRAGTVRRLFQTILGLAGLILVIFGTAQMTEVLWRTLVGAVVPSELAIQVDWRQAQLSGGLALTLIGALILHGNGRRWQTLIAANPAEAATALRRFYLYAAVVVSALAALAPAALLLRELLIVLLGSGTGSMPVLLDRMGAPVSFIPAGLIGWAWHRRYLRREADRYGASLEAETIRRIYYYAVAATALALLWFGLTEILSALLDALLNRNALVSTEPIWVQPLATGLSLTAVSAPIWAHHWRTVQAVAARTAADGHVERDSAPRKVYLYGVALVGAVLILINTAQMLYRLLLVLLGEPGVDFFTAQTAQEVAQGVVAAGLWMVHIWAIRADGRRENAYHASQPALVARTEEGKVATNAERRALEERIVALEAELTQAKTLLAALHVDEAEDDAASDVTTTARR